MKIYNLCICYNEETEEVEYIQEEMIDDTIVRELGDIIIDNYFDNESLELIKDSYIVGES